MTQPAHRKSLILIRGLPGSGKTTLARCFVRGVNAGQFPWDKISVEHYEADDYFLKDGKWHYNGAELWAAQRTCLEKTKLSMMQCVSIIVVSNCFIRLFELEPYLELARTHGYAVQEIIAQGDFQNTHEVPPEALAKMRKYFQIRPTRYNLGNPLDDPSTLTTRLENSDVSRPI